MKSILEKPVTVIRQELIETLVNTINNSGLPLVIIEPILKDIYLETKAALQRQYELEKMQYENGLKEKAQMGDANETE